MVLARSLPAGLATDEAPSTVRFRNLTKAHKSTSRVRAKVATKSQNDEWLCVKRNLTGQQGPCHAELQEHICSPLHRLTFREGCFCHCQALQQLLHNHASAWPMASAGVPGKVNVYWIGLYFEVSYLFSPELLLAPCASDAATCLTTARLAKRLDLGCFRRTDGSRNQSRWLLLQQ